MKANVQLSLERVEAAKGFLSTFELNHMHLTLVFNCQTAANQTALLSYMSRLAEEEKVNGCLEDFTFGARNCFRSVSGDWDKIAQFFSKLKKNFMTIPTPNNTPEKWSLVLDSNQYDPGPNVRKLVFFLAQPYTMPEWSIENLTMIKKRKLGGDNQ